MRTWGFLAFLIAGCGDNTGASGPQPLVPDPAVVKGCVPGPLGASATRAKVVACSEELIGGRLAGGRVGDFVLENAKLRAIIRGRGEGLYQHGSFGGGLVDVAAVGGEDLIKEIQPTIDLAAGAYDELVITEAGDDGDAEIVVRGPATSLEIISAALDRVPPPVIIEHHYRLAKDAAEIELETKVFPVAGADATGYTLFEAMFTGGRARAFLPGKGWAAGQGGAEMIATDGTTSSYAFVYPTETPNPQLIDLGGIRLIQGPSIDVSGQKRWLVVGDGSIASVTDRGWQLRGETLGEISGTTSPGAHVVIRDLADNLVTIGRGAADGTYRALVPLGSYVLQAEADGHAAGVDVPVLVGAGSVVKDATVGPAGTLTIFAHDDTATPLPARVVIERPGYDRRIHYTGVNGRLSVAVPPGTCRVSVSRGLEYDAFVASALAITDGGTTNLDVPLAHVLDTAGWISLDTHLHSELSTDSTFPVDDRLRAVAAEGVEVPVSADHDFITEYAPIIAELGLGNWVHSLDGDEVSSIVWGHTIGFPLVSNPAKTAHGGPHWARKSPAEVFAQIHASPGAIVQINHPRRSKSDFFDAIDLDPDMLTAQRDPTELGLPANTDLSALDFDAMEVANVVADDDFEVVFADFLALVAAGHATAATGSTDSHGAGAFAGEARTYVYVGAGADSPATVTADAITDAIRARRVVVGTGAFVTAGIVGATSTSLPGDTATVAAGTPIKLHIKIQAPPWQPLSGIRIYERKQQIMSIPLSPADTATVRFDADVTLAAATTDTFFVVRVEPAGAGDPVLDAPMPSFTNPVFVHVP